MNTTSLYLPWKCLVRFWKVNENVGKTISNTCLEVENILRLRVRNRDESYSLILDWENHIIEWKIEFAWLDRIFLVNWKIVVWVLREGKNSPLKIFIWNEIISINWKNEFDKIPSFKVKDWFLTWRYIIWDNESNFKIKL